MSKRKKKVEKQKPKQKQWNGKEGNVTDNVYPFAALSINRLNCLLSAFEWFLIYLYCISIALKCEFFFFSLAICICNIGHLQMQLRG